MSLITNIITEEQIEKATEYRTIMFTNAKMEKGFLSNSNFFVKKILPIESNINFSNLFDFTFVGEGFNFKKAKHAYVYNFSEYFEGTETLLNFKDFKNVGEGYEKIYILPLMEGRFPILDTILEKEGIDTVLEWFDSEDPFLNVFNQIHKSLGNNPDDFII